LTALSLLPFVAACANGVATPTLPREAAVESLALPATAVTASPAALNLRTRVTVAHLPAPPERV